MQAKYPVKVQAIRSKGLTNQFYVFIPLPLAAAIGLDGGEEASMEIDLQEHTTGQTIWSVGGRDYATGEEKGEKEIAYLCQPRFFMQGFFSGIKNKQAVRECRFPLFIHCERDNFVEVIKRNDIMKHQ